MAKPALPVTEILPLIRGEAGSGGRTVAMAHAVRLQTWLDRAAIAAADPFVAAASHIVTAVVEAGNAIADLLAAGPLAGALAAPHGTSAQGKCQKYLDLRAHALLSEALRGTPTAALLSEEADEPVMLAAGAPLVVAVDPLDGSSNIDTGAPVGTIFAVLPAIGGAPAAALLQSGRHQVAAGYLIYGPQTALVLSLGDGTSIFTRERPGGAFLLTTERVAIPPRTCEYAINAANERHWEEPIRLYVADCQRGATGPRGADFNTRWIASLVAEAFRIMMRGGVYLYPADARRGYARGRLRLIYEANPIAFLVEQAGGAATDGSRGTLDLEPTSLHQRVPLVFGSRDEVAEVARYQHDPSVHAPHAPLFGSRSLFRVTGK